MLNKKLGQVFTPENIVEQMLNLRKNVGSILEPSCGDGIFLNKIKDCVGIEYDSNICPKNAINLDFFDYSLTNTFDTIIGNPPYIKYTNICDDTKIKLDISLFNKRSNLYLFFIEKSIKHLNKNGELIFIVPRDFIKSTSSKKLNKFIYENGTITDLVDLGDQKIFKNATPNTIIFRFEKDNFSRITNNYLNFIYDSGQLYFLKNKMNKIKFSDLFFVKVGAVSGCDELFKHSDGIEFVCSYTAKTTKTKSMLYNKYHEDLLQYKNKLIKRKIKKFNENNWYMWGRDYYKSRQPRIYVNVKTRIKKPFFIHDAKSYDGTILAIFPKHEKVGKILSQVCDLFNEIDWGEMGFMCGNRYIFSQQSLENCILPDVFEKFVL